jgi:hypothetical protein
MTATRPGGQPPGARLKEHSVFDLTIDLDGRPDALAVMGEALGQAGVSIEGGGMASSARLPAP